VPSSNIAVQPSAPSSSGHPSEASGLLVAAADGHRGYVPVREAGDQIALADDTASFHNLDLDELRPHELPL
jgi:hypothetical protein